MPFLDSVHSPSDLRALSAVQLSELADEIRSFLIRHVSRTGGHLGPNLGVVELTLALHRVFDSPHDPIVFDTGHQSYVHKILTGRQDDFPTLRQKGGLSGYPARAESPHDWVENSHATTSLSWAEGMAKAFRLRGEDRTVVAVIGDGALTGGMAWEALNNIAVGEDLKLVIVVNDNGRSYTPTVGGLATHLSALRTDRRYERTLATIKQRVRSAPLIGGPMYDVLHGFKTGVKDILAPQGMFSDLGIKYVGPIDGHDLGMLERALESAKNFSGPVIVHAMTVKGKGFRAAEEDEADRFHAVGLIDEETGEPLTANPKRTWTDAVRERVLALAGEHDDIVGITAAMLHPTGLDAFAAAYPDRVFDVGIAEQHAVTSAAGLAAGGLHPVVALYATFLNRAFDQVLMDVAMHGQGVTFLLDRAGITGPDGASHHGMWDTSLLGLVPGVHLAAPRDERRLGEALGVAASIADAPSVIRYSKDPLPAELPAVRSVGGVDVLAEHPGARVLIVAHGPLAHTAVEAAGRIAAQGIGCTVVDPVWALPVNPELVALCRDADLVVTVEDAGISGGLGSKLALCCAQAGVWTPMRHLGIPQEFHPQASRAEILDELGLTGAGIARTVVGLALERGAIAPPPRLTATV
ncbi:MAG: 1-deoxy-D-xylulose-5-phosphate synthase [Propioniciclava sp.]|uniref:1-deoxy-D-xylulose-5-phosphate synthase n=1 Tax=Propioniciclava sp. TaxID=2038686 RepID=UPI0039E28602